MFLHDRIIATIRKKEKRRRKKEGKEKKKLKQQPRLHLQMEVREKDYGTVQSVELATIFTQNQYIKTLTYARDQINLVLSEVPNKYPCDSDSRPVFMGLPHLLSEIKFKYSTLPLLFLICLSAYSGTSGACYYSFPYRF